MAARGSSNSGPRSLADATRFTSNTPHAKTKAATPNPSTASAASRSPTDSSSSQSPPRRGPTPAAAAAAAAAARGGGGGGGGSTLPPAGTPTQARQETPDQRVRRLRAAHLAAKQHSLSRLDRLIDHSRRYFDAAHKFGIAGLIGFSGLALIVTAYASVDMMVYNRKRRSEFFALQKQLDDDSLESARLAYMAGTATEDQIALVEEATAKARQSGVQLPALLSAPHAPAPPGGRDTAAAAAADHAKRTVWPGEAMVESNMSAADEAEQPKKGLTSWLFSGLRKEETRENFGYGEEEAAASDWTSHSSTPKAVDESRQSLKDKAKTAFEQERVDQRRGGPLDQLGLDDKPTSSEGKKGWW